MSEEMANELLRIYKARCEHYTSIGDFERAIAYSSCISMLEYAIKGDAVGLGQFDYF